MTEGAARHRAWWLRVDGQPAWMERWSANSRPSEARLRRARWLQAHRLKASLLIGAVWGLTTGSIWSLLSGSHPVVIIGWVVFGCAFYGPLTVWSTSLWERWAAQPGAGDRTPHDPHQPGLSQPPP